MAVTETGQEIDALVKQITALEEKILKNKIEYRDRTSNPAKYESRVRAEVNEEQEAIYLETNHIKEDNADNELVIKSIKRQMGSVRMFEGSKMSDLDRDLNRLEKEIEANNTKIPQLEMQSQEIGESLEERLDNLEVIKENLAALIEADEQKLAGKKEKLTALLAEVE